MENSIVKKEGIKMNEEKTHNVRKINVTIDKDALLLLLEEFTYLPAYQEGVIIMEKLEENLTKAYKEDMMSVIICNSCHCRDPPFDGCICPCHKTVKNKEGIKMSREIDKKKKELTIAEFDMNQEYAVKMIYMMSNKELERILVILKKIEGTKEFQRRKQKYWDEEEKLEDILIVIRTDECADDDCQRVDSITIPEYEVKARTRASLHGIVGHPVRHKTHLRMIYYDEDGRYLGDVMKWDK